MQRTILDNGTEVVIWAGRLKAITPEAALIAAGVACDPETLRAPWLGRVKAVAAEAGISLPTTPFSQQGGRRGHHGEAMGHLLAELQYMQRTYPAAQW